MFFTSNSVPKTYFKVVFASVLYHESGLFISLSPSSHYTFVMLIKNFKESVK